MNRNGLWGVAIVVAGLMGMPACHPGLEGLETSVEAYHDALRWRDFSKAASFVAPHERMNYIKTQTPLFSSLRVTEFTLEHMEASPTADGQKADRYRALTALLCINEATGQLTTQRFEQVWEYNAKAKEWWITEQTPLPRAVN